MREKTNERINENMECQFVDGSERRWLSSGITLDGLEEIVMANTDNEFNMESKEFNGMDISMYCDSIKMERDLSGKIAIIQFSNMGTTLELYAEKVDDIEYDEEANEITISTVGCSFQELTITIN